MGNEDPNEASRRDSDKPPLPDQATLNRLRAILGQHPQIQAASIRRHQPAPPGSETGARAISRRRDLWLSLMIDEPPAEPRTPAVRDLITTLSGPVHEATGITAVGVVAEAGVRAFQRDGVRVYDRA